MATNESRDAGSESTEAANGESSGREISVEEFNPTGTLALMGLYFLILLGMYVFMYFVEFAGRGISITG